MVCLLAEFWLRKMIQSANKTQNDKFKFRNYIWQCVVRRMCVLRAIGHLGGAERVTHAIFTKEKKRAEEKNCFASSCEPNMTEIRISRKALIFDEQKQTQQRSLSWLVQQQHAAGNMEHKSQFDFNCQRKLRGSDKFIRSVLLFFEQPFAAVNHVLEQIFIITTCSLCDTESEKVHWLMGS